MAKSKKKLKKEENQKNSNIRILAVDDDEGILSIYDAVFSDMNFDIVTTKNPKKALETLKKEKFSLVLADMKMPGMSGLDLISKVKDIDPNILVIVVTGYGTIETAVSSMKIGAYDYIAKPFMPEELVVTVEKALAFSDLEKENENLKTALANSSGSSSFVIGSNERMKQIYEQIKSVAISPATILIRGESGTGKEVVADEIHRLSPRADKPFVKINCAAIPEHLLEDELFGHEKGAFTGANSSRAGKFEIADEGTILLDEIGDMPPLLQVKLLRILQEQRFHRLGSNTDISVDVRIICATNTDLEKAVSEGDFREDLYYRLNVVEFNLPPLRERREDIPHLAKHILDKLCLRHAISKRTISEETLDIICKAGFPGNIRELQNILEHSIVFCKGSEITYNDLPRRFKDEIATIIPEPKKSKGKKKAESKPKTLDEIEAEYIESVLNSNNGNMVKTAKELNISRSTLYNKVKKAGLIVEEP